MSSKDVDPLSKAVIDLIEDYNAFNPNAVDILHEEPTPLEFMRFVARNRPFVIRAGAASWPAVERWDKAYLAEELGDMAVNVAMTPFGNADVPLEMGSDDLWFVKPFERDMPFDEVLDYITKQELRNSNNGPVLYAQTRRTPKISSTVKRPDPCVENDNLRGEYESLFTDVLKTIPFAKIALNKEPDAINFWLGNSKSTTALHKDPYENIYVQIRGKKHFTILPPYASACVNTKALPAATYVPLYDDIKVLPDLEAKQDVPATTIPFATWDVDKPELRSTPFSQFCQPIKVTLEQGDMLYLPALWYHKVQQSCSAEGFCCAVNYWFDMDYTGGFYPFCSFARAVGDLANESHDRST